MKRLYHRTDAWLRELSRGVYGALIGILSGLAVLIVGQLMSEDLLLIQAVTVALTMFAMHYMFDQRD